MRCPLFLLTLISLIDILSDILIVRYLQRKYFKPMNNSKIADIFEQVANMLDLKGELPFKVNAYRKAARVINDLQDDIRLYWESKRLNELPGIGNAFVKKIDEYLSTGKINKFETLKQEISPDLLALLKIQGLGPKTLALAHKQLGVNNIDDLKAVTEDGRLSTMPNMGLKKVENIKKGIEYFLTANERTSIAVALPVVEEIIKQIKTEVSIDKVTYAGSVRRMKETVLDVDILAASKNASQLIDVFTSLPGIGSITAAGKTKASVRMENGLQIDLRVVELENYGAALQYFTGSQAHNIKLRSLAKKKLMKINEYGIFKDDIIIASETESEMYEKLGLQWIPPELREDRGEIERAARRDLPVLVEQQDIFGDLHVHSNYSDGKNTISEMAQAARRFGYHYLAICDHSVSATYANGLTEKRLVQQIAEIEAINASQNDFTILKGCEVDIRADGSLDFPDELLSRLDFVIASIHSGFKNNPTERILKAMKNPFVDAIGHPTGRLISRREAYQIDLHSIYKAARLTETALEINAHPERLDLSDTNAKAAVEAGVKIVINTESHDLADFEYMKYGIATARRGWLTKENIINCVPAERLSALRKKRIQKYT